MQRDPRLPIDAEFTNKQMVAKELCLVDNRAINITTKGTFKSGTVKLIFSSVFRLQFFVKLISIEWAELVQRSLHRNLKISTITWNMGQKKENTQMFEENPMHFFKLVDTTHSDILTITG